MTEPLDIDKDGVLDNTPLKFGKYKGRTATQVYDLGGRDAQYLVWAYENVGNYDVCSKTMYKDLGGSGKRADPTNSFGRSNRTDIAPEELERSYRRTEQSKPAPKKSYFDDMDDDIPF